MALFVDGGVEVNGIAFVEFRGLLEAGHATESQCWTDQRLIHRIAGLCALVSSLAAAACYSGSEPAVFDMNGAQSLILERRAAHVFLSEYRRMLTLRSDGERVASVTLFVDTGGYGRANLYEVAQNSFRVVDAYGSYMVDTKSEHINRENVHQNEGRFVGAFDEDATGRWRFISAQEKGELPVDFRGD